MTIEATSDVLATLTHIAQPLLTLLAAAALSCVVALVVTPIVRRWAIALGIVDAPDGFRKLHARSIPLCGGVAVVVAVAVCASVAFAFSATWTPDIVAEGWFFAAFAAAALWICVLGVIDDRYHLRGRQKLFGQILAALIVIAGGLTIEHVNVFGIDIELGLLAVPVTLLWLLGAVNALNLIDGADGLATTVGIIISAMITVLAVANGYPGEAAMAAILAGALAGFLVYNWPPAKIFLGDAGSMFIGFCLGLLAIRASLKGPATVALVAPTAIWAIPLFDVAMAVLRRKLTGQSIYATDRGHLHHTLQRNGWGGVQTVLIVGGLCVVCGLGALASVVLKSEAAAAVTTLAVFALLVTTRSFGHAECDLFARHARRFLGSLLDRPAEHQSDSLCSRFHGNREFNDAWQSLLAVAQRFDLAELNFNINAPMLGEVYHAHWQRRARPRHQRMWRTELPMLWNGTEIGRLALEGSVPGEASSFQWSSELLEACRAFETQVIDLLEAAPPLERSAPKAELLGAGIAGHAGG